MKSQLQKFLSHLKSKWVLIFICSVIISGTYYSLMRHYKSVDAAMNADLIYTIESKILDIKFNIRGPEKPTGEIGILAIDEKAITKFGDWPFSRKFYGRALRNLKKLGVKYVGFDGAFPDKQIARINDIETELTQISQLAKSNNARLIPQKITDLDKYKEVSPGDANFAKAVQDLGNVILGFFYFGAPFDAEVNLGKDKSKYFTDLDQVSISEVAYDMPVGMKLDNFYFLRKAYGMKSNYKALNAGSEHFAFFNNDADYDAINRWVTLVTNVNGVLMPSLGLKVVAEHLNSDIITFFNTLGVEAITLVNRDDEDRVIDITTDPYGAGRLLINSRGPSHGFKHYSLADAYFNTFTPQEKKELKGMSLLVGGTASGTKDQRPNVFDPGLDGVENHAAAADNIIRQDFLRRDLSTYKIERIITVAIGLMFAPLMIWGSSILSGLGVIFFVTGFLLFDWFYWFSKGTWAYTALPIFEITGMFVITTFYKYLTEEREKRVVKGAFQHYLSPEVIDQVLEDPESLALGGKKQEITVFFSDVRDFTSISEGLPPEQLSEFMNEYFTPMTSIILESQGTLDKYIGDAIMAFWGAPIAIEDHAEKASLACLKMLYALDKLQEEFPKKNFPPPKIGMGLNTGVASVGNMGSNARFSYTAMGDSINLGARLEGLTKEYGIQIMISEFTAARISRDRFLLRDLDDIRVKGKQEPVKVFDLMRPDLFKNTDQHLKFIEHFETGRKAYRDQQIAHSIKAFEACLNLRPDDKASHMYIDRLEKMGQSPLDKQWDGVYTFKHK